MFMALFCLIDLHMDWKNKRTFPSNPVRSARDMSVTVCYQCDVGSVSQLGSLRVTPSNTIQIQWANEREFPALCLHTPSHSAEQYISYYQGISWSMVGWQWQKCSCSWASFVLFLRSFPLARLVARPTQPLFSSSRTQSMRRRRAEPSSLLNSDSKDWRNITA